jgi:hypothetical protein
MPLALEGQPTSLFRPEATRHGSRGALGRPLLEVGVGVVGLVAILLLVVVGIAVLVTLWAAEGARA